MSQFDRFAGIGISKNRLDIHCHPEGLAFCAANPSDDSGFDWGCIQPAFPG